MDGLFTNLTSGVKKALENATKLVADEQDDEPQHEEVKQEQIEFAEGLTCETFTAFPKEKLDDSWIMVPAQEAHAKSILELSENLRSIRFRLCPRELRDEDFWQIYFVIVQGDLRGLELNSSWAILCEDHETVTGSDAVLVPESDSYWSQEDESTGFSDVGKDSVTGKKSDCED